MTKFVGEEEWVNTRTGEVIKTQTVAKELDGDIGFHKIWLHEILELINEQGNAKTKALMWLLSNMDAGNRVVATHAEIAEAADISTKSVARLMAALEKADVIQQTHKSRWRINPKVIFKGSSQRRGNILIKYREAGAQPDMFEEQHAEAA